VVISHGDLSVGWSVLPSPLPSLPSLFPNMPPTRSQVPRHRAKRWCFTWNNPTPVNSHALNTFCLGDPPAFDYIVYGRESAPTTGTLHYQGYVILKEPKSLRQVKSLLSGNFQSSIHLEVSRGTPQQNREYCIKDGNFNEFGELPSVSQGRRTDLERFFEWADEFGADNGRPPTTPEVARNFPTMVVKHSRLMDVVRLRTERRLFAHEPEPKQWQQRLSDALELPAEDRKIIFVIDPDGGLGKSWFCRWFIDTHPDTTQILRPGKVSDVAHAIKAHISVFLFDVPRGGLQFLQSQVIEQLKDQLVFSPKYASQMKYLDHVPHVVVLSNEHPTDVGLSLTLDRYEYFVTDDA